MARRARPPRASRYGQEFQREYFERIELADRMGIHDFTEHYGRDSGGSPYAYEYSERTIEHRHPGGEHLIGFTRPLRPERPSARPPRRPPAREPRRAATRETPRQPRPRRPRPHDGW